jgi:porphobilinogen synthase
MVRETHLRIDDLIMPFFVCTGKKVKNPIPSMPGNYQLSPDTLLEEIKKTYDTGVRAVLLFGIPDSKDSIGSSGYKKDGIIQQAVGVIKKKMEDVFVITDVCNCEYTDHGHCGVIKDGDVDNDATLELLVKQALSHAEAGCDMVAPSDMMDGRVKAIRDALDKNGFSNIPIMSYAVKYSSAFYGPFRDAAESVPKFGDRKSYQMDPANSDEAIREAELDINEGADIIMVKPALSFLDIIRRIKDKFCIPIAAYNVSGEFAMVKAASEKGWLDEEKIIMEILTSIKRAGADIIISYHSNEIASLL